MSSSGAKGLTGIPSACSKVDKGQRLESHVNKKSNRCNSMQIFIHCKTTLHVSGVTAPIIRSIKNCTRSLRYRYTRLVQTSPDLTT